MDRLERNIGTVRIQDEVIGGITVVGGVVARSVVLRPSGDLEPEEIRVQGSNGSRVSSVDVERGCWRVEHDVGDARSHTPQSARAYEAWVTMRLGRAYPAASGARCRNADLQPDDSIAPR